jgi:hypothetical protein
MTVFEYLNLRSEYERLTRSVEGASGTISDLNKYRNYLINHNYYRANEICDKILKEI